MLDGGSADWLAPYEAPIREGLEALEVPVRQFMDQVAQFIHERPETVAHSGNCEEWEDNNLGILDWRGAGGKGESSISCRQAEGIPWANTMSVFHSRRAGIESMSFYLPYRLGIQIDDKLITWMRIQHLTDMPPNGLRKEFGYDPVPVRMSMLSRMAEGMTGSAPLDDISAYHQLPDHLSERMYDRTRAGKGGRHIWRSIVAEDQRIREAALEGIRDRFTDLTTRLDEQELAALQLYNAPIGPDIQPASLG